MENNSKETKPLLTAEEYAAKIVDVCHHKFPLVPLRQDCTKVIEALINEYAAHQISKAELKFTKTPLGRKCDELECELSDEREYIGQLQDSIAAKDRQIEELKAGMEEIQNLYKGNYEMPAAKALKKAQIIAFQTLHNINSKP